MRINTARTLPGFFGAAAFCALNLAAPAAHAASPVAVAVTPNPLVVSPGDIVPVTVTFTNNASYSIGLVDGGFNANIANDGNITLDTMDSSCESVSFELAS